MEKRETKGNRKIIANTVYKKGTRSKGRGVFELFDVELMEGRKGGGATGGDMKERKGINKRLGMAYIKQ